MVIRYMPGLSGNANLQQAKGNLQEAMLKNGCG